MQTIYLVPQLAALYQTLGPRAEALLRVCVGAFLISLDRWLGWEF